MWAGFAVVLSAMILNILDSTIVNVAAPAIQRDLAMSTSSLEWVAAAYTLALAVGLMAGARLGDMFGRKRMLLLGLVGFVLSSAFCSFAWSGDVLVVARAAQGLSAALMVPQTFGLIRDLFPPQHIGKAFAAFGPVIGLSTVLGPVVAGLLMKADLFGTDWRALFLINLPLGVFALVLGMKVLPDGSPSHAGLRLDGVGTLLLGAASFLLVFPLVDGRTLGWPTWVFGVLAASLPMLAAFVLQQRARLRAGRRAAGRVQRAAEALLRVRHAVHAGLLRQHRRLLAHDGSLPPDRARVHRDARQPLPRRDGRGRVLRLRGRRLGGHGRRPTDPARRTHDHGRRRAAAVVVAAVAGRSARVHRPGARVSSSSVSGWG